MRPRDLLDRARRLQAEREAAEGGGDPIRALAAELGRLKAEGLSIGHARFVEWVDAPAGSLAADRRPDYHPDAP